MAWNRGCSGAWSRTHQSWMTSTSQNVFKPQNVLKLLNVFKVPVPQTVLRYSTSGGLNVEWVCRFAVEPITHFASKEGQTSLLRRFTHCLRSPKRLHGRFGQNHENMFCSLFNSCKLLKCEFERTFCASFSLKCRRCPRNVLARLEWHENVLATPLATPPDQFLVKNTEWPRWHGSGSRKPGVVSVW